MRVKFWGTRGSIPTPGRATEKYGGNTTCVEVEHGDARILLDAGTGVRELGLGLAASGPRPIHFLMSHVHWDHIQGLPFFVPLFLPGWTIRFVAPPRFQARLRRVLYKQMARDVFPVAFGNVAADVHLDVLPRQGTTIGPFQVDAFRVSHPGTAWGYRLRAGGRTLVYATDTELDPDRDPASFRRHVRACQAADLLVADGQYVLAEHAQRRGWGHSPLEHTVALARAARVRRLAITHHDPMRHDDALAELEQRTRRSAPEGLEVFFAREGMAVEA